MVLTEMRSTIEYYELLLYVMRYRQNLGVVILVRVEVG